MLKVNLPRRVFPALLMAGLWLGFFSCISKNPEQPEPVTSAPVVTDVTGGFHAMASDSEAALRAYGVARAALADRQPSFILGAIIKAESQVVAGIKIRLHCEYREAENAPLSVCRAVVFIDLNDNASLVELELKLKTP